MYPTRTFGSASVRRKILAGFGQGNATLCCKSLGEVREYWAEDCVVTSAVVLLVSSSTITGIHHLPFSARARLRCQSLSSQRWLVYYWPQALNARLMAGAEMRVRPCQVTATTGECYRSGLTVSASPNGRQLGFQARQLHFLFLCGKSLSWRLFSPR